MAFQAVRINAIYLRPSGSVRQNSGMPTTADSDNAPTCGFVGKNRVALGGFRFFPALPYNVVNRAPESEKRVKHPSENSPLNAKTAFRRFPRTKPDVPSQGLITVGTLRKSPAPVNPQPRKPQRIKADQPRVSKVTCEQKNTHYFAFSQLRCKF